MTLAGGIIFRELRQQSRQPGTYWLRFSSAAWLVGLTGLIWWTGGITDQRGDRVLRVFHQWLFFAIWVLVPLMVADCLSKERREGTLGLLFLTPLRPMHIVIAKSIAQTLRGLCFLVASLPVIVITILQGGVNWENLTLSITILGSALCWSLGAGLIASSQCKSMQRALLTAMGLAGVGLGLQAILTGWILLYFTPFGDQVLSYRADIPSFLKIGEWGAGWLLHPGQAFTPSGRFRPGGGTASASTWLPMAVVLILGVALTALVAAMLFATRTIAHRWREEPPSAARQKLQTVLCKPRVAQGFYRQWLARKLERNPIGWLDQRTWQMRVLMWIWLAVLISVYSSVLAGGRHIFHDFHLWQRVMCFFFLVTMAGTAASSFQRERESGVLELLLVSPQDEVSLLCDRLRGLWGQFAPAMGLMVVVWMYLSYVFLGGSRRSPLLSLEFYRCLTFVVAYGCVPIIGLYFSLRMKHFHSAFLWTLVVAIALPIILGLVGVGTSHVAYLPSRGGHVGDRSSYILLTMTLPAILLLGLACAMFVGMVSILVNRLFAVRE